MLLYKSGTCLLFVVTITFSEFSVWSKPVTIIEQIYSPISWSSSGENTTVLPKYNVSCSSVLVWLKVKTRGDSDNEVLPLHSTLTSDGDTPTTTIAVHINVWGSPIIDPSTDCDMLINISGTNKDEKLTTH